MNPRNAKFQVFEKIKNLICRWAEREPERSQLPKGPLDSASQEREFREKERRCFQGKLSCGLFTGYNTTKQPSYDRL